MIDKTKLPVDENLGDEISDIALIETLQSSINEPKVDVEVQDNTAKTNQVSWLRNLFKSKAQSKEITQVVPIRVIIGFLPEVLEQDALEYAMGVAEKYFDQIGIAYFDAFAYANGYAFEIHEGGLGRAYLPEIIKYFDEQGEYQSEDPSTIVIKTSTRNVEVQSLREGLTSIVLSENSTKEPSDWLRGTEKMHPAIHKRTGLLILGSAIFITGFVSMIGASMLTRYTPYIPPPESKIEVINPLQYPKGQWSQLEQILSREGGVKSLRYRNNRWEQPELWPSVEETAVENLSVPKLSKKD